MVNFVMKRAVLESPSFDGLKSAFDKFNQDFKAESSKEGFSINSLIDDINAEIDQWQIRFGVSVNPIRPEDIVKNLLSHYVEDVSLGGKQINLASFGQGLQRHLIFTLIKLSAKYTAPPATKKKDFDPDFTFLLFEEPEAFLHPSQQVALHASLRKLGGESSEQVLISSHSPHFVSKQVSHLEGIIRLEKRNGETKSYQITKSTFDEIIDKNIGLYRRFCDCLQDSSLDEEVKREIRNRKLGDNDPDPDAKLEDEAVKYFLWLDSERASMFFAKKVIICEGASEKIFIDYLFDQLWPEFRDSHIYLLDALGKFNIHRYMTLLSALGIEHAILMDSDGNSGIHAVVNSFLEERKTNFTRQIHAFESDFEDFLGITKPGRNDLKPLNVIVKFQNNEISASRIDNLKEILEKL